MLTMIHNGAGLGKTVNDEESGFSLTIFLSEIPRENQLPLHKAAFIIINQWVILKIFLCDN